MVDVLEEELPGGSSHSRSLCERVCHPLYSAFLLLAVGLAVLSPLLETVTFVAIFIAVIVFCVDREEKTLLSRYGEAYGEYMRRTRWKLLPGVF